MALDRPEEHGALAAVVVPTAEFADGDFEGGGDLCDFGAGEQFAKDQIAEGVEEAVLLITQLHAVLHLDEDPISKVLVETGRGQLLGGAQIPFYKGSAVLSESRTRPCRSGR